ncbi:MAG: RecQ family ATP-dependent DNA helicase [Flavisolibacter sp.]
MKKYWGHDAFRPMQEDIIRSVLSGVDTLAILPTGGGKSVCFQVPALAKDGICIVVSPLIALMKDQVDNLKKRDIPALLIHSGMTKADVKRSLENARHNYFKFLYVSPERLETSLFREYLPAMQVNLLAIDEAHCISQWGYDFRPSYIKIAALREELPGVPVLALTASATADVQKDICEKLKFSSENIFRQSFERKNLSYSVFRTTSKMNRMVEIISKVPGTAIVYCKSRRRTTEIMQLLQMHGLAASNYHAGLLQEERSQRQKDWIENKVRVMVCTNAFGMGIDKPDVRLVVHADMPDCLENYYQEAGRAGRDGKKSYAVLLYDDKDLESLNEQHAIRFPGIERIREVYNALVNYLQIPSYTGEYTSFEFQYDVFVRNFKLNAFETMFALKALEQDGWIVFNERNFTPSTVFFTTSKERLHEFQNSYPQHEVILTTLLRTYSGILDYPAMVSENFLSRQLRTDEAAVKQQLKAIAAFGVISYTPQNENPRIIFQKHRVPAEELSFKLAPYEKRKNLFIERVQKMIAYAGSSECRSLFINAYFGDNEAKACGICDNCLNAIPAVVSPEEFKKYAALITEHLHKKPSTGKELVASLKGLRREKAWKIIGFLQAENKIFADSKGLLQVKVKS